MAYRCRIFLKASLLSDTQEMYTHLSYIAMYVKAYILVNFR